MTEQKEPNQPILKQDEPSKEVQSANRIWEYICQEGNKTNQNAMSLLITTWNIHDAINIHRTFKWIIKITEICSIYDTLL